MNRVILMGRLTRDPDVRYSQGENSLCIARYTLAVDRRRRQDNNGNEQTADFISCVAFGRQGEFVEKYLRKGVKMLVNGRIQTGSYTNKDGVKVYTTEVVVEDHEFAESKGSSERSGQAGFDRGYGNDGYGNAGFGGGQAPMGGGMDPDGFMSMPQELEEDLPFA